MNRNKELLEFQHNMPFGDFETNIGNRDFNVINCHRLYLGEATQKSVEAVEKGKKQNISHCL